MIESALLVSHGKDRDGPIRAFILRLRLDRLVWLRVNCQRLGRFESIAARLSRRVITVLTLLA